MKTYLSFAISDTMFPARATMRKRPLLLAEVKALVEVPPGVISALNPSHKATIEAIKQRFGIELPIPAQAPKIQLSTGDRLIVCQAHFPRRLAEGERYSDEEVAAAEITFSVWSVF